MINDPARPSYYECGFCNRKYPVSDFDKPEEKKPKAAASGAPPTATAKETTMALAKDDSNTPRLWQLNSRRRAKGLPPFDSLQKAINEGAYKPRGTHAAREKVPAKPSGKHVRGGYKKHARPEEEILAEAVPTPAAVRGKGHVLTARAIALGELDKMIAALTSTRAIMASIPAEC